MAARRAGRWRSAAVGMGAAIAVVAAGEAGAAATPADTGSKARSATSAGFAGPGGDFDGDGKDDVASFTRGRGGDVYVARSTGARFAGIGDLWSDAFGFWSQAPLVGDFDGDRRSDVAAFARGNTPTVAVALSTGRSFGQASTWQASFAPGVEVPAVGDVNGDGKADVVAFSRGRGANVTVALSTGRSFGRPTRWTGLFASGGALPGLGDVNGDGRDDLVAFGRDGGAQVTVALSTGRSFRRARANWLDSWATNGAVPGIGDFDGDGSDDIAAFTRGGTADVFVALSTGRSFRPARARWHEYFAAATEIPQPGVLW
jgi:hypothetical protein